MNARFYIEHETEEYIYIIDTGIEDIIIRDDAKNVVEYLRDNHKLDNRRIIYRNRHRTDDEIKHLNGHFMSCDTDHKGIDLPKDSAKLLECMEKLDILRNQVKYCKP